MPPRRRPLSPFSLTHTVSQSSYSVYSATSLRTRPENDADDCPPPLPAPLDEEEEDEDEDDEEEEEEEEEEESRYFRTVSERRIRTTPFVSLKTFRQHCIHAPALHRSLMCICNDAACTVFISRSQGGWWGKKHAASSPLSITVRYSPRSNTHASSAR